MLSLKEKAEHFVRERHALVKGLLGKWKAYNPKKRLERLPHRANACIIFLHDGHVFVVQQHGKLSLPGGKLKAEENPLLIEDVLSGALRETVEETGWLPEAAYCQLSSHWLSKDHCTHIFVIEVKHRFPQGKPPTLEAREETQDMLRFALHNLRSQLPRFRDCCRHTLSRMLEQPWCAKLLSAEQTRRAHSKPPHKPPRVHQAAAQPPPAPPVHQKWITVAVEKHLPDGTIQILVVWRVVDGEQPTCILPSAVAGTVRTGPTEVDLAQDVWHQCLGVRLPGCVFSHVWERADLHTLVYRFLATEELTGAPCPERGDIVLGWLNVDDVPTTLLSMAQNEAAENLFRSVSLAYQ